MQIEFTVEEYFRELKLMQQQYGQEEELYPLINILLRGHINSTQDVSIRSVAGARYAKTVSGRKLLSGGGKVFPDIAILSSSACMNECKVLAEECIRNSREYIYGCVEAKPDALLEFKDDKSGAIYSVSYERKIQKRLEKEDDKGYYFYYEKLNNQTEEVFSDEFFQKIKRNEWKELEDNKISQSSQNYEWVKDEVYPRRHHYEEKNLKVAYRILEQFKSPSFNNSNNKKIDSDEENVSELLNEIIWYEKVLYTNGKVWKYLELESIELEGDRKWKCEKTKFRLEYFNGEKILEQIKSITIKCFTICKLDLEASEDDNKKEWNRLEENLSIINWSGKTEFKNFI